MKKFITLLAITSLFIGCEVDEELNDNPNAFTDAPIGFEKLDGFLYKILSSKMIIEFDFLT